MFPIVDAHIHLWDLKHLDYPWLSQVPAINRTYLPSDYDSAVGSTEISAVVFIQGECRTDQYLDELRWVQSIADNEPRLKAIVPWAPLEQGSMAGEVLSRMSADPRVKGIRRIIQFEADPDFCVRPGFIRGVQILSEYGLHFELTISPVNFPNVMKLVEACPDTTFILDHIGNPDILNSKISFWQDHLNAFAQTGPHFCKFSNLVCNADLQGWTCEDLRPFTDIVIETFGPDRLIWGSDWPHALRASSWQRWLDAADFLTRSLGEKSQRKIFHDNAIRFYRLDIHPSSNK